MCWLKEIFTPQSSQETKVYYEKDNQTINKKKKKKNPK